ncbi:Xylanase inhibitor, C-terminal [Sesbania bispinosa]|nr:Xylanase inhibitor, C-terminal [Sesbania bispinosa]
MGSLLFFVFLIFWASPLAHSRNTPHSSKTTLLNVAASIKKTHQVLNLNQQQQQLQKSSNSKSSSSLSLQLHSRASLQKPSQSDYRSLTLARLERDSARVRSILTQLDPTINVENLAAPIISGTSQGSGEYFSRVGIGEPPSPAYMVLDTGSDISWVQCAPCADCYQQADPIFEPSSSASYAPLSCEAAQCKWLDQSECRNDNCLYEVSYGDGSYTVGDFVTETITIGSASVRNIAIGCGHSNEGLFIGAAGLLGLGGGSLSFPAQLNSTSFSYCLVDRDSDSASTLEFDSPFPNNSVTAPLRRNPELDTFYYVGLAGISVGGELLPIPESSFEVDPTGSGGIIVDSGTAVTRLQSDVYNLLRDAFVRGTRDLPAANGVSLFDTCYDLSSKTSVEVPTVAFHFGEGKVLVLPAKNYLIPVDSVGTFCFAFAPTISALSIIGNVQQEGTRVGFDLANSLVGFSPNSC